MKRKILLLSITLVLHFSANAQQPANGPAAQNTANTAAKADLAWRMGGNRWAAGDPINQRNIFGFAFGNSPIYTQTDGAMRSKLNGTFVGFTQYTINGFIGGTGPQNINTSGYFLLGVDYTLPNGTLFYNTRGAFSLMHLNGNTNGATFVQDGGFRPWMKTGITFTDNQDRAYVGYRANALDVSDFVINWSDNSVGGGVGAAGPDNLIFNFTAGTGNNPNGIDGNQYNGREVVRMTGYGYVGIGPRFDNTQVPVGTGQGQPQSLLHLNINDNWQSWLQISNQSIGQTVFDGVRLGIVGAIQDPANPLFIQTGVNASAVGIAMLYQQENQPLLFSTNAATNAFNGSNATLERVRLQAAGTATQINGGTYAVYNPAGVNANFTRMAISHNPNTPITRPLALLHLGYNSTILTNDGWRPWMDVGTYYARGTDNMYVGLKQNPSTNRQDAIINWGNENVTPNGPDRLRIVFTTTAGVSGNSGSTAGLEMMQFASDPSGNETRIGVGSFDLLPYNIPQNTMHINSPDPNATTTAGGQSGLRFEDLNTSSTTIPNPGQGVLSVNANGDVVYVTAPNGIGNYCSQPQNPLTGNYEVPMNDFNIYYSGQGTPTTNAIGIGVPCGTAMPGKLTVYQDDANPVSVNTTSGVFLNSDNNLTFNLIIFRGVRGVANGENNVNEKSTNIGGDFRAESAGENIAVQGNVSGTTYLAARSFGGKFFASGLSQVNYGVYGSAFNGNSANYGVYGEAPQTTSSYAGYFAGNLLYTGSFGPSDQNLKTNIQSLTSADSILNLLNPVTFDYLQSGNAARLNLPTAQQMGLIAQEVETVLPNLVKEATHPAEYDTLGNVIAPSFTYKVLDYEKIIPVLLAGHKEQSNTIKTQDSILQNMQAAIQSQDSINQSLQQQINTLYNMITACCNANSAMGSNTQQTQNANQNSINVELKDVPSVILDQNVPNPFAEQTTITYTLPEGVHRAQILFYNAEGKLINTVDLSNQSGKGQINVFANDLSNGVYTYTLVVDGKIIDTKRMVKQK